MTKDLAPYCVATRESPRCVEVFVVSTKYLDKLDEALSDDRAVRVATINPKLAAHPLVAQAINELAEAIGAAVNELAVCFKATGYKNLDQSVDNSTPH